MSFISLEKQEDAQALHNLWEIIGMGMNLYMRTENENVLRATQENIEFAERLKLKMDTHDYTEDDARRTRVEKRLKEYDKNIINKVCQN